MNRFISRKTARDPQVSGRPHGLFSRPLHLLAAITAAALFLPTLGCGGGSSDPNFLNVDWPGPTPYVITRGLKKQITIIVRRGQTAVADSDIKGIKWNSDGPSRATVTPQADPRTVVFEAISPGRVIMTCTVTATSATTGTEKGDFSVLVDVVDPTPPGPG